MGAEEDTEIEEDGHVSSDASSILGIDARGTVDHGDGSRESVQGREDEDDGEGGDVGANVGVSERNDAKDDEREEDRLQGREEPVPLAGHENDEFTVRLDLGDEARQGAADEVSNLENTNEQSAEPALLQSVVLRGDVEKQAGEDGQADEEDPEDVQRLRPELSEQREEGGGALHGRIEEKRRVVVVDVGRGSSRGGHLSLVLLEVVADELHARHGEKRNEASEDDSTGDREVSDGGLLRSLSFISKASLSSRLGGEDDDTSDSVTTHDGGHVLGREHASETEERSDQDSSAETADRSHGQDDTERSLRRDDRGGESVLHGDDGEDNNLDGKTDQETSVRARRRAERRELVS